MGWYSSNTYRSNWWASNWFAGPATTRRGGRYPQPAIIGASVLADAARLHVYGLEATASGGSSAAAQRSAVGSFTTKQIDVMGAAMAAAARGQTQVAVAGDVDIAGSAVASASRGYIAGGLDRHTMELLVQLLESDHA